MVKDINEANRIVGKMEPHYDQIWKNYPMPVDYTCPCGLYVHPSERNADAIHISDCPYNNDEKVGE